MAISLNNHESRIKTLEGKIGAGFSDTGWINAVNKNMESYQIFTLLQRYRVVNNILYIQIRGRVKGSVNNTVACQLPQWKYGSIDVASIGIGDKGGVFEGNFVSIDASGNVKLRNPGYWNQWVIFAGGFVSYPLTIYYIVRYNIYKLVQFLSHLNTKFGGERR